MALVTAERLHRWKCKFCGSKDKNIVNLKAPVKTAVISVDGEYQDAVKIVCCNQCGKVEIFSHSALMLGSLLYGNTCSIEDSEKYVKKFHDMNHFDPKANHHSEVGPKFNENT